jgi:hypothetical protein
MTPCRKLRRFGSDVEPQTERAAEQAAETPCVVGAQTTPGGKHRSGFDLDELKSVPTPNRRRRMSVKCKEDQPCPKELNDEFKVM